MVCHKLNEDEFQSLKRQEIVDYMHDEKAYKDTTADDLRHRLIKFMIITILI